MFVYKRRTDSFWTTTLSGNITSSTVPTWTDQGIGIEQLCPNEIIVAPVANRFGTASRFLGYGGRSGRKWQHLCFDLRSSDPDNAAVVAAGWSIDYASSDPNFIVLLADGGYAGGPKESSYSTNDGQTLDTPASNTSVLVELSEVTSQPAHRNQFHFLPVRMEVSPTTRSMAETPGIRLLFQAFPAGPVLLEPTIRTTPRGSSRRTAWTRIHFIYCTAAIGVFLDTTNGGVNWTEVNSNVANTLNASVRLYQLEILYQRLARLATSGWQAAWHFWQRWQSERTG